MSEVLIFPGAPPSPSISHAGAQITMTIRALEGSRSRGVLLAVAASGCLAISPRLARLDHELDRFKQAVQDFAKAAARERRTAIAREPLARLREQAAQAPALPRPRALRPRVPAPRARSGLPAKFSTYQGAF